MKRYGFTLIEIIATLVILGFFSAMLVSYFGPSITKSSQPIVNFQNVSNLNTVMSDITSQYNKFKNWSANTSYVIGDTVVPSNANNFYYTCTTAGISGATEPPNWTPSAVVDGTVVWAKSSSSVLQFVDDYVNNTYFSFVQTGSAPYYTTEFDSNDANTVLKVIISSSGGGALTSYFMKK